MGVEQARVAGAQGGRRQEPAFGVHVALIRRTEGARNVSPLRVHRLVLAPEAVRGAAVEEHTLALFGLGAHGGHRNGSRCRGGLGHGRRGRRSRAAAGVGQPSLVAAVEHRRRRVAGPTRQPPQPGGEQPVVVVVGHQLGGRPDAVTPQQFAERRTIRQRMAAGAPRHHGAGKVAVQIQAHRAGNVAGREQPWAGAAVAHVVATVEHPLPGGRQRRQAGGVDQRRVHHTLNLA